MNHKHAACLTLIDLATSCCTCNYYYYYNALNIKLCVSNTVESVLKDGHVPPLPQNYVRRQELVKSIRKELRKLKDSDSWVVIYGLPGFG